MQRLIRWGQPNQTNVIRPGEAIVPNKKGPHEIPPEFAGPIPALGIIQNILMAPVDYSVYFQARGTPTSYAINLHPVGLIFDTTTGVLSGTPSTISTTNSIITASNAHGSAPSNEFAIEVTA